MIDKLYLNDLAKAFYPGILSKNEEQIDLFGFRF